MHTHTHIAHSAVGTKAIRTQETATATGLNETRARTPAAAYTFARTLAVHTHLAQKARTRVLISVCCAIYYTRMHVIFALKRNTESLCVRVL